MIISSAPGRCGIIGNPTDMYGGSVISCSTTERAHCSIVESDKLSLRVMGQYQELHTKDDLEFRGDRLDIAKAILRYFELTPENFKCRIEASTDVPEQAGLAGSTAMTVVILGCIATQLEMKMNNYLFAETAHKIENHIMGIVCGYQDQYMAVFGGLNYMDFRGKEMMLQDDNEPLATVECLSNYAERPPLVLAHTGVSRNSGSVHKSIRDRWLEGEAEVRKAYDRIAELARLGKKALISGDWQTLGELMNENHAIQQQLGGSGEENDRLIQAALENGALGAKLAGAGKGGTIIALTLDPKTTIKGLLDAGADRIMRPRPNIGLVIA